MLNPFPSRINYFPTVFPTIKSNSYIEKQFILLILCLICLNSIFLITPVSGIAQKGSYIREALQGAIFIYDSATKPCDPPSPGKTLLPLGSGFIVGLARKGEEPTSTVRHGIYKFLVTAQHVIAGRDSIIVRLNRTDKPEFACFSLNLFREGIDVNIFTVKRQEVDLIAINVRDFPNTDPTVFDYSLILDEELMRKQEVREGTDIFTVGYLYSYSGHRQNYPVAKFGKIAMLTNEKWYYSSPPRNMDEEAYLVELQNVPGLSGAPVMLLSPQFRIDKEGKFQYRRIEPHVIGIIKGLLPSPVGGTQGVAAIEPAYHLRELLEKIAGELEAYGIEVELK